MVGGEFVGWFFGRKEEEILNSFFKHIEKIQEGIDLLERFFDAYEDNDWDLVEEIRNKISDVEHEADVIRRDTENGMYSGAFLPNFRGDLLGIIESADKIMNKIQTVADLIWMQHVEAPLEIRKDLKEQVNLVIKTFKSLATSLREMFDNMDKAQAYIEETEKFEHEEDLKEKVMISTLFKLKDMSLAEKLQIKELILNIGDIADLTEDTSDRVQIVIMKRKV